MAIGEELRLYDMSKRLPKRRLWSRFETIGDLVTDRMTSELGSGIQSLIVLYLSEEGLPNHTYAGV